MKRTVDEVGLRRFGNDIQLVGVIYQGKDKPGILTDFLLFFPGEKPSHGEAFYQVEDWEAFLRQVDTMETEVMERAKDGTVTKAIVRKSQRQIEGVISWRVFRRDGFACRYCGAEDKPLTVDHVITWESGGPSIEANLVSSCKKCNRTRGDMLFAEWLEHPYYKRVCPARKKVVSPGEVYDVTAANTRDAKNRALLATLDQIPLRVSKRRR